MTVTSAESRAIQGPARYALLAFVASVPIDVWVVPALGTIGLVAGVPLLLLGVPAVLHRGAVVRLTPAHYAMLGFTACAAASILWSIDTDATIQRIATYGQLVVVAWLFWQLAPRANVRSLFYAYLLGAACACFGTVIAYLTGQSNFEYETRYVASGFDPNDLGVTAALGVPFAWYLFATDRTRRRWFAFSYLPLALFAVGLTASRGAAMSLVVALAFVPLARTGGRGLGVPAVVAAVLLGAVAAWSLPGSSWDRIFTIKSQVEAGNLAGRAEIWDAGLRVLSDQWLGGVGAGAFGAAVEPYIGSRFAAHNVYLSVAAEEGVLGLVLFLAPFFWVARRATRLPRLERNLVFVSAATWAVGVSALTWEYRKPTWLLLSFLIFIVEGARNIGTPKARAGGATS